MDQQTDFSDFESEEFDILVNEMWSEKRKERIQQLKEQALHTIKVSFQFHYLSLTIY